MIAYAIPGVTGDGQAFIRASRLASMGGWTIRRMGAGILAHQGASWPTDDYRAPYRTTAEGWTYFGPREPVSIHDLTKPTRPEAVVVRTILGTPILVPVALRSPRLLCFDPGAPVFGKRALPWAERAIAAWDREQGGVVSVPDEEVAAIVFDALASCYRLTRELLSDLGVLTAADLVPILLAIWGYDPPDDPGKAPPAGGGASPSPPAGTMSPSPAPTSPSSPSSTETAA